MFGTSLDMQTADDFSLTSAYFIDRVTVDMTSGGSGVLPANVLVEFFADAGRPPSSAAHSAVTVSADRLTSESSLLGPGDVTGGFRMSIDLGGLGIELGTGNWWFSVVGISDDDSYMAVRRHDQVTGSPATFRNGGVAHGNGAPLGPYGTYNWTTLDVAAGWGLLGDLNARIEGTLVPAPGASALLGLAALGISRRRR